MKHHIETRIYLLADYILKTKSTVRKAGKKFGISKSTVHKDVSERLHSLDKDKYFAVKKILDFNLSVRHIRGGCATKEKYLTK